MGKNCEKATNIEHCTTAEQKNHPADENKKGGWANCKMVRLPIKVGRLTVK